MRDIIVTWPKGRQLRSYLHELTRAGREGLVINYRVSRPPKDAIDRCYLVYNGEIVGYNEVIEVVQRGEREVGAVGGGFWPAGWYVVRRPQFFSCRRKPMRGFQGWRYFDRMEVDRGQSEG